MKKSYNFDTTNISSSFTGTYTKLDNPKGSKVHDFRAEYCCSTLDSDLSKKNRHQEKFNCFIKMITQFFSLKESGYSNGSKICTDKFLFDYKF